MNPNATRTDIELLERAVTAYKSGDLETLRTLAALIGEQTLLETGQNAIYALLEERERLQELIRTVSAEIEAIKSREPYTLRARAEDAQEEQAYRDALESKRREYEALAKRYEARLRTMRGGDK